MNNVVDLPAPLAPSKPSISPFLTSKETSWTATEFLKVLRKERTSITLVYIVDAPQFCMQPADCTPTVSPARMHKPLHSARLVSHTGLMVYFSNVRNDRGRRIRCT